MVSEYNFDGGKWTCGLEEMHTSNKKCIVYSFGSHGDDLFESDVLKRNPNCEIHIFDPTSSPKSGWSRYRYHSYGLRSELSKHAFKTKRLSHIMSELGHSHVDILKADIEGTEWTLLNTEDWSGLRVGQILIELHLWAKHMRMKEFWTKYLFHLERHGFLMQTVEPVSAAGAAFEVTFLNVNWSPLTNNQTTRFDSQAYFAAEHDQWITTTRPSLASVAPS